MHIYTSMSFGTALDLIITHRGASMRLPKWDNSVRIKVQWPDEKSKMTAPYLYVESQFGLVPWKETMIEMFDTNWVVTNE